MQHMVCSPPLYMILCNWCPIWASFLQAWWDKCSTVAMHFAEVCSFLCKLHCNTCDQQMLVCLFSHVFIPSSHALFVVYAHMYGSQDDEPIKPTMHLNRRKNGLILLGTSQSLVTLWRWVTHLRRMLQATLLI